jgi:hypothetical protein
MWHMKSDLGTVKFAEDPEFCSAYLVHFEESKPTAE